MHGTAETPALFAELVCAAVANGSRVLVGFELNAPGGHAWNCSPECAVHPVRGRAATESPSIVLTGLHRPGYDGLFNIGRVTASLPLRSADQLGESSSSPATTR
jgi:hypothetical protein